MNIFLREIKSNFRSFLIWGGSFALMVVLGMVKYSGAYEANAQLTKLIAQIPPFLKTFMGFGDFDLSSAIGFYGLLFYYLLIMAAIHACFFAANIISKEEQEKTTEFLVVKPISRSAVILPKLMAAFLNVVLVNLITFAFSLLMIGAMNNGVTEWQKLLMFMLEMLLVQVIFIFVGSAIATMSRRPKLAATRATVVLMLTFLLARIIELFNNIDFLKYFTPFKYFSIADVINTQPFDFYMLFLTLLLSAALCLLTFLGYNKRDLNI